MSYKSIHRPEVGNLIGKVMRLTQGCPTLPVATKDDKLYTIYSDSPCMDTDEEEDGIWIVVDRKLTATFGIDCIKENLMQGSLGIELAMKYLSSARDHPTWTLNSDMLLERKLEMIAKELLKAGASDFLDKGANSADKEKKNHEKSSHQKLTKKTPNLTMGIKCRVVSHPDVEPDACHSQPKKPAAKRPQLHTLNSKADVIVISSDDEVTKPPPNLSNSQNTDIISSDDEVAKPCKSTSEVVLIRKKTLHGLSEVDKVPSFSNSENINLMSSDDEVVKPLKSTSNVVLVLKKTAQGLLKVDKVKKAMKILDDCPLSTPDTPCNRCKIDATSVDKEF
ncbi:hypothetical protein DFH28DRAFT_398842 [Melampsora americana]|nr:hypothetical protein DFH28DRAFT_398842 [Melampsora americana]